MTDLRLIRAERLLSGHGLAAQVRVAGHASDVLAVQAPIARLLELRSLAPQLKELGFRYIALELNTEEQGEPR